jgi:dTDP-4-dehydrorhamnose reductase
VDAFDFETVSAALSTIRPDAVVNCIGVIKHLPAGSDPLSAITLNAQFPHRLAAACRVAGARLIHLSTDCVFSGRKGGYTEEDRTDAEDLYGQTKMLGEVRGPGTLTLRGSFIGHELKTRLELVDWFLSQTAPVRGFTKAIYSGLPTIELARVISDFVLPDTGLEGLYNVSSAPINKHDLLQLVAERYGKRVALEPYEGFVVDRSLDSARFKARTGYAPPAWKELVESMHADYLAHAKNYHAVV